MVTQRQVPKMALIQPVGLPVAEGSVPGSGQAQLVLEAPGMPTLEVPIVGEGAATTRDVRVWEDKCPGVDQGDAAAAWLSKFMGREAAEASGAENGGDLSELRLVWFPPAGRRPADPKYSPGAEAGAYSDGFPFLVVSEESLLELNARLPEGTPPLPMDRFRPNIVIAGSGAPFLEDQWERIKFLSRSTTQISGELPPRSTRKGGSSVNMRIVKPCSRCKIPTTDQATGKQATPAPGQGESEPTRTLRQFRTGKALRLPNVKWRDEVFFGQNAVLIGGGTQGARAGGLSSLWQWPLASRFPRAFVLRVGDDVVVQRKQAWVTWGM